MGYSCSVDADNIMRLWVERCRMDTGMANVYVQKGKKYIFEQSRREHADGGITGGLVRVVSEDAFGNPVKCTVAGSFKISGDGTVLRGPKVLRDLVRKPSAQVTEAEVIAEETPNNAQL